ncbi:MAG: DUF1566 domain-containing protein [Deltaproteobacteria bacterium]|nr:DUF1566 domain-containing protein [Deltaproteobacteria bacterium]
MMAAGKATPRNGLAAVFIVVLAAGCIRENDLYGNDSGPDGGGATDTGSDADADTDTDADTDADADTDTFADAGHDAAADGCVDADGGYDPMASQACVDGDVRWIDSCGRAKALAESCTGIETCEEISVEEAACCTPEWYEQCHEGDVSFIDSCGLPGDVAVDCPNAHAECVDLTATTAECRCLTHWDMATSCTTCVHHFDPARDCDACEHGWGGPSCAACEIGYTGLGCGRCAWVEDGGVEPDGGVECRPDLMCKMQWQWLDPGALPADAHSGDDFQIAGTMIQPTVVDTVTGLTWRRCREGQSWNGVSCTGSASDLSYTTAQSACASAYGGHSDWRVPDLTEILSLIDFSSDEPFVDLTTFPGWTRTGKLWSSNAANAGSHWFYDLTGPAFSSNMDIDPATVACIRSEPLSNPRPRFRLVADDGSVFRDEWSGLTWQRCPLGTTWDGSACDGLEDSFFHTEVEAACSEPLGAGWRLPKLRELLTIFDMCPFPKNTLRMSSIVFGGIQSSVADYASGTLHYGYEFAFNFSGLYFENMGEEYAFPVLCVK